MSLGRIEYESKTLGVDVYLGHSLAKGGRRALRNAPRTVLEQQQPFYTILAHAISCWPPVTSIFRYDYSNNSPFAVYIVQIIIIMETQNESGGIGVPASNIMERQQGDYLGTAARSTTTDAGTTMVAGHRVATRAEENMACAGVATGIARQQQWQQDNLPPGPGTIQQAQTWPLSLEDGNDGSKTTKTTRVPTRAQEDTAGAGVSVNIVMAAGQ